MTAAASPSRSPPCASGHHAEGAVRRHDCSWWAPSAKRARAICAACARCSPARSRIRSTCSCRSTARAIGITNGGVGSNRYRVSYDGPGGHSYGAFGMPNPIHAMGRAIAKIADLQATHRSQGHLQRRHRVGRHVGQLDLRQGRDGDRPAQRIGRRAGRRSTQAAAALREALREERARWPQSKVALDMKIDTMGLRAGRQDSRDVRRHAHGVGRRVAVMNVYAPLTIVEHRREYRHEPRHSGAHP